MQRVIRVEHGAVEKIIALLQGRYPTISRPFVRKALRYGSCDAKEMAEAVREVALRDCGGSVWVPEPVVVLKCGEHGGTEKKERK